MVFHPQISHLPINSYSKTLASLATCIRTPDLWHFAFLSSHLLERGRQMLLFRLRRLLLKMSEFYILLQHPMMRHITFTNLRLKEIVWILMKHHTLVHVFFFSEYPRLKENEKLQAFDCRALLSGPVNLVPQWCVIPALQEGNGFWWYTFLFFYSLLRHFTCKRGEKTQVQEVNFASSAASLLVRTFHIKQNGHVQGRLVNLHLTNLRLTYHKKENLMEQTTVFSGNFGCP